MKFRRVKDSNRRKQWTTRPINKLVSNCRRSTAAFLRMSSKKRSSCSSALTFFLIMILHKPRSENFQPPTSGNPGDNGKTIPTPPTHPIHPNGLTTPNRQPATMILMTLLPSHSQHSPPTTPHLIVRRKDHQAHRGRINPKLLPASLQDT